LSKLDNPREGHCCNFISHELENLRLKVANEELNAYCFSLQGDVSTW